MNLGKRDIQKAVGEKVQRVGDKIEQTPEQKLFLFFLTAILFSSVVLGYFQFSTSLKKPFFSDYLNIKRAELEEKYGDVAANSNVQDAARAQELQRKDSDLDGLSDYSELYIHLTDPYSADSDGDGITDKQEINRGNNPNCAQGEVCSVGADSEYAVPTEEGNSQQQEAINLAPTSVDQIQELQQKVFSGEVDLSELGISNEELIGFVELLNQGNGGEGDSSALTATDLETISAAQIREELLSRGFDESILNQFSDDALESLFVEVLQGQ